MSSNPEYFREVRVNRWAIVRYLDFCLAEASRNNTIYNHNDTITRWLTSLTEYAQLKTSVGVRASKLLSTYYAKACYDLDDDDDDDDVDSDNNDDDCESVLGGDVTTESSQTNFEQRLQVVAQFYQAMVDPFKFSTGNILEDICNKYAMSLKVLQPVHFGIVDSTMKSLFEDSEWNYLKDQTLPGPCFPKYLDDWLKRYDGITTTDQCRQIVHASYASFDTDDREKKDDKNWIDDVVLH
ncbi:hypothetical protein Q9L58_004395 [Maublancomyces gigas]|uniref:Uncharacterized protein n=1 Tax=Discina gigas TaxID=1032678 RepID=A0ABR3GLB1_9PEZI